MPIDPKKLNENDIFRMIGVGAAVIVFLLLFVISNYLNDFQARAGWGWGIAGIVLLLLSVVLAWKSNEWANGWYYYLGWLLCIAFAIMFACGFNFDMFGITDRP